MNFNAQFMEVMNTETGFEYDFTQLNPELISPSEKQFNLFSWYLQFAADTLENDVTGFSGIRADAKLKLGFNQKGDFLFMGKVYFQQQFELIHDWTSLGYSFMLDLDSYPYYLVQSRYDLGGFYGLPGHKTNELRTSHGAMAGIMWKQKLLSPADMPLMLIAQLKTGFYNIYFDVGASLHLALKTPFGNLMFGGGCTFDLKYVCLDLCLM